MTTTGKTTSKKTPPPRPSAPSFLQPGQKSHLITSPGFVIDFFYWLSVNFLIYKVVSETPEYRRHFEILYDEVLFRMMGFAEKIAGGWSNFSLLEKLQEYNVGWMLISLLASSCCAFQLILNLFSFGCAGFNTYLGPLRPFFLALAACIQIWMWRSIERPELQMRSAYVSLIITVFMSFMPEMVYVWTIRKRGRTENNISGGSSRQKSNVSNTSSTSSIRELRFSVESMACVACVNTITNGLLSTVSDAVVTVQANLDAGVVTVEVEKGVDREEKELVSTISQTLEDLGFPAKFLDVISDNHDASTGTETTAKNTDAKLSTDEKEKDGSNSGNTTAPHGDFSFLQAFVAGSLSSSCCLIQLGLNFLSAFDVLHIGCAGFNKVLGPLRPYTRGLTFAWLAVLWGRAFMFPGYGSNQSGDCCDEEKSAIKTNQKNVDKNDRSSKGKKNIVQFRRRIPSRLLSSTLFSLFLMFLPEALLVLKNTSRSTTLQKYKEYVLET
jgi:copper chaperone CopZ